MTNRVLKAGSEVGLHVGQRNVIVRALGTRETRDYSRKVELKDIGEDGVLGGVAVIAEKSLGLQISLDIGDLLIGTASKAQVVKGLVVDGEVADRSTHLRRHVGNSGPKER